MMKYKFNEEYNMWWKFDIENCQWRISEFGDNEMGWLFTANAEMYSLTEAFKFTQER
jgi:hypothetical protein